MKHLRPVTVELFYSQEFDSLTKHLDVSAMPLTNFNPLVSYNFPFQEKLGAKHRLDDGKSVSRNVASLHIPVHDMTL